VARVLIVGGGCRGRELARGLVADGHAVRITARTEQRREAIEATGAECWIGDPDVIGSLRYAMDGVAILCWVLGTAAGEPEAVRALHDTRLAMMLSNVIDSTVRGLVYEAAGTVAPDVLASGAERVGVAAQASLIPFSILHADPLEPGSWALAARASIERLLAGDPGA
jgi:nucleoside-diphosphate-sugar epimerase